MSNVTFAKGLKANLPTNATMEGKLYFTEDTGELYESTVVGQPLVKVGDVYSSYVDLADLQTKNPAIKGKLYLTDDSKIYVFTNNNDYTEVSGGGFSGQISANDVIETPLKVFVTNPEKSQIGANTTEIESHSQRIAILEANSGGSASTDEKVKMNALGTSGYLEDLIDSSTIVNNSGKLSATTLLGLTATLGEINQLQGVTGNVQSQLDALSSIGNFTTTVESYADLQLIQSPVTNDMVIVLTDETKPSSPASIYIYNGTVWVFAGDFKGGEVRNFTTDPIELATETTGILPKVKYEKQNASETSVTDTNGNLTATNVEDALAELFTYANNIKSIANIIGYPLNVSDTSNELNDKTQQLKGKFSSNLNQKGVSASPFNTLEELVNKITVIPNINVEGNLKKISKINIVAPYELKVILEGAVSLSDITTTLIEFINGDVGVVVYDLKFNNGDSINFEPNEGVIFDGVMKLKKVFDFNMEKDSDWSEEGYIYTKDTSLDSFSKITKMKVFSKAGN